MAEATAVCSSVKVYIGIIDRKDPEEKVSYISVTVPSTDRVVGDLPKFLSSTVTTRTHRLPTHHQFDWFYIDGMRLHRSMRLDQFPRGSIITLSSKHPPDTEYSYFSCGTISCGKPHEQCPSCLATIPVKRDYVIGKTIDECPRCSMTFVRCPECPPDQRGVIIGKKSLCQYYSEDYPCCVRCSMA